ncbi:MAG: hypothetical protein SWK90_08885 [Chloroflexota bacterium]|nr:hypothetical protein [Chloroflexota bacterium]
MPEYTQPWIRQGVSRYHPIVPDENGALDFDAVSARLRKATGIFIGGGHTPYINGECIIVDGGRFVSDMHEF